MLSMYASAFLIFINGLKNTGCLVRRTKSVKRLNFLTSRQDLSRGSRDLQHVGADLLHRLGASMGFSRSA